MPFAVVGSDKEYQVNGKRVLGRKTAWGVVEGKWPEVIFCGFFYFYADFCRDFVSLIHLFQVVCDYNIVFMIFYCYWSYLW